MSYKYQRPTKKKSVFLRPLFLALAVLGVVAVAVAALELTGTTHIFREKKPESSTIPAKSSADSNGQQQPESEDTTPPNGQAPEQAPPSDKTTAPPVSGAELLAPSGSFASNHLPSLTDSPAEESICVTTPGASCAITFTKDGITKTLESKKTDASGAVSWTWDVKSAGFVPGVWQITATATLDGQTKSSTDLQPLGVQP